MPKLLVSVRSANEARSAALGGASIIDIKEPDRGPLGRAESHVWRAVVQAVGSDHPVSVALGELSSGLVGVSTNDFEGLAFRKVGLADSGPEWRKTWKRLRDRFPGGPAWVAVVYADWASANAPEPEAILDEALTIETCSGILVDTWDKSRPSPIDLSWRLWFERARLGGRFTALAGSLDHESIQRLAGLEPDIIAVRGAACVDGNRRNAIDSHRVASLARLLGSIGFDSGSRAGSFSALDGEAETVSYL